jgi:UDP:flavonoid glycosyltransferase YjiC (YdhE family)
VRVIATTASIDPATFRAPANARVERFLPHGPLLQEAACVVCHGGMGITQKALAAGVPVCVVPFGRDQLEVARHVEISGAGTRLASNQLSPERLRNAVREAMANKPGALRVAEAFRNAGGPAAAADVLEDLKAGPRLSALEPASATSRPGLEGSAFR